MKVSSAEVLDVLTTLVDPVFAASAATIRDALRAGGVATTRTENAVPVTSLVDTYRTRRANPRLPPRRAAEFDNLLDALGRSQGERWHIYAVGENPLLFAVFAAEDGTGRACLDLTSTGS